MEEQIVDDRDVQCAEGLLCRVEALINPGRVRRKEEGGEEADDIHPSFDHGTLTTFPD